MCLLSSESYETLSSINGFFFGQKKKVHNCKSRVDSYAYKENTIFTTLAQFT